MPDDPDIERPSLLRRILPWMSVFILIAVIYDGSVLSSLERQPRREQARAAKEL